MTIAMRDAVSTRILCVFALLAAPTDASENRRLFAPRKVPVSLFATEQRPALEAVDNEECTQDTDCDIVNSKCQEGFCKCIEGEIVASDMTKCLPAAIGWGAVCEDTAQCSARLRSGGICVDGFCQCANGFHYQKGRCWLSAGLGGACSRNERCYANFDAESFACKENKCQCAPGHYQREYTSCRRQSSAPGEDCGINVDCHFKGAICEEKLCACPKNTIYDETKKECIPSGGSVASRSGSLDSNAVFDLSIFEYGHHTANLVAARTETKVTSRKACKSDKDCEKVRHSTCIAGQCVCNPGYFTTPTSAFCYPELLQTCASDKECQIPQSFCRVGTSGKVCSCRTGFVASQNRQICRKMSRFINWSCLHPEQCSYFGPSCQCQKKKCTCIEGSHWEEEKQYCWMSVAIGGNCTAIEDCRGLKTGSENVNCENGVCSCSKGYHSSGDKLSCRKDAETIGDICEENEDCSLKHSACIEKKCDCGPGYFQSNNSPVTCIPGINGECFSDSDCIVSSSCVQGQCQCQPGFVATENGRVCLKEVKEYAGACEDSVQCALTASICREGKCLCSDDTHFRDGLCRMKKALGTACSKSSECYLENDSWRAECRNGLCQCKYDFYSPLRQECATVYNSGESSIATIGSLLFWTILTRYL